MTSYTEAATELFKMAMERVEAGDIRGAIGNLSLSVQTQERPGTYFERAKLYRQKGDLEKAIRDVERARELCVLQNKSKDLLKELNALHSLIEPIVIKERARKEKLASLVKSKDIEGLLEAFELLPFQEAILKSSRMSVRLHRSLDSQLDARSRLGGQPDLPAGFVWPQSERGTPLSFLGQFSTNDLIGTSAENAFLETGTLSFFYDAEEQPRGYAPVHRYGWKVFYFSELEKLFKTEFPETLDHYFTYKSCNINFQDELTFEHDSSRVESSMTTEEDSRYFAFCTEWYKELPHHHLFGLPQNIQNPEIDLNCQLASNGIYLGDSQAYASERALELAHGAKDWRLLLQVDSDSDIKMDWGDAGTLYFYIKEADLKAMNFENVWLVLQCF